ncbi:pancreatic triacylglycerol lipase [Bactrocera oleae]|uniref:pancreatic triacylglycerol lipase n=1 Tax=Bactrocera oleae TaxID=104688 RepID=UPI0006B769A4|nr:pancreatic triacylglycerol lipase [Bactrocera oleae]XP_014103241.1 pancreatic triacylglycerol lipase [Bactrocera oleae]XP_014103242.1 pancreatic triacylglycerol lipase [Bactrocera oleae]XP_036225199.1 pancreatic triacylglycerol lipase [Bactrocera oleae]XP_036225200.1 pancreatic triacylglycerol lipase [Bactrocera oleae]XP_036225201.1 pancreatic triacylglycerol lipase [Bactrocera oleae]
MCTTTTQQYTTVVPSFLRTISIIVIFSLVNCHAKSLLNYDQMQSLTRVPTTTTLAPTTAPPPTMRDIVIGPCRWVIGRKCPDKDVRFYLYTRRNPQQPQYLNIDETSDKSNLTNSNFNPRYQTKIIIHGYNADMYMNSMQRMKYEYLMRGEYNIIFVDWAVLAPGPCYVNVVHNTKHVGACVAQLVERILETGTTDMHVIGFSLGAQLTNYVARNLGSFQLPRITGLDPAMPFFITSGINDKLDPTDAAFVDVIHTNAFVQGKIERCGHADFYMNGGILQPGCNSENTNPFACSHQRAVEYFAESIRSRKGFWGWPCSSYISYLLNMCPPTNYLIEAGEDIKLSTKGMFLAETNDTAPYALGKWTDLPTLGRQKPTINNGRITITLPQPSAFRDPLLQQVDQWNKLDSHFNGIEPQPTPYSQDPNGENWTYFSGTGTGDITDTSQAGNDSVGSVEEQSSEDVQKVHETQIEWLEYRRNLTNGHIENSIFKVPHIEGAELNSRKLSRQPRGNEIN